MSWPDFVIVGAPKAGTTALHAALTAHPQLYLSPVKEPKFFLTDGQPPLRHHGPGDAHSGKEWIWRQDAYEGLFEDAPSGALRGESTPFYLSDFGAHARLRRFVPDARLIAVLRDPVDRAYSNWMHLWSDGLEPIAEFVAACEAEPTRIRADWGPFWHYQRLGRYGEQLENLMTLFPREQVHLLRYRDLVDNPADALDSVYAFLGVEQGRAMVAPHENVRPFVPDTRRNRRLARAVRIGARVGAWAPPQVWRQAGRPLQWALHRDGVPRPRLTEQQRAAVLEGFRDDIALLGQVTGSSFDDWLHGPGQAAFSERRASTS